MTDESTRASSQLDNFGGKDKQWEPGQSGNPKGLKPGTKQGIRAQMNRILKSKAPEKLIKALESKGLEMGDGNFSDILAARAITKAATGDVPALKYISEQTEAALPKAIEVTGADQGPVRTEQTVVQFVDQYADAFRAVVEREPIGEPTDGESGDNDSGGRAAE